MSFTLTFGQEGPCATAQVVWSVDGNTYNFRSDNNFVAWISTIFTVADVVASSSVNLLSSNQNPPVQGGTGNLFATYNVSTSPSGNARGTGAVDLQQYRQTSTQVASGLVATIGGGKGNTSSGSYATVGGGMYNEAVGGRSTVGGGYSNNAVGNHSTVGGGRYNESNSAYGTVSGGSRNTALVVYATVGGGYYNIAGGNLCFVGGGQANNCQGGHATVGGGYKNSISSSANYTTVGGGRYNTANGEKATIAGGELNSASAIYATVGGGRVNTASADYATVVGGATNTASASYATVGGGRNGLANRYGMFAHASGQFSKQGDAQAVEFVARNTTVGATSSVLFLDGSSTVFGVSNNSLLSGILTISGFNTTGAKVGLYQRSVSIKNVGGTTTLVHSSTISTDHEDDATWAVTITADNATDSLNISCTGSASDTVRWVAVFRGLQILMP